MSRTITTVLGLLLLALSACSSSQPIVGETRFALVIGNGAYQGDIPTLTNPPRDAAAIATALEQNGYRTVLLLDANRAEMLVALRSFAQTIDAADLAIVFYSGHGVEIGGHNLLLPTDFALPSRESNKPLDETAIRLSDVDQLMAGRAKASLIFLDACRTDPYAAAAGDVSGAAQPRGLPAIPGRGQGLALEAGAGTTATVYSAQPGQTALDGTGAYSPFATAFLLNLPRPNQEIRYFLPRIKLTVSLATGQRQVPAWATVDGRLPATRLAAPNHTLAATDAVSLMRVATATRPPLAGEQVPSAMSQQLGSAYQGQVLVTRSGASPTGYTCFQERIGQRRTFIMAQNSPPCGGDVSLNNGRPAAGMTTYAAPAHGQVFIKGGTFLYAPHTDFTGQDRFVLQYDLQGRRYVTINIAVR